MCHGWPKRKRGKHLHLEEGSDLNLRNWAWSSLPVAKTPANPRRPFPARPAYRGPCRCPPPPSSHITGRWKSPRSGYKKTGKMDTSLFVKMHEVFLFKNDIQKTATLFLAQSLCTIQLVCNLSNLPLHRY